MSFLIHQYLDHHAHHQPHSEAVSCLDTKLSYSELQNKANQLAHRLIALDVHPGSRVGIYMDKCIDMAVAIYGILKAGAVYVPLDPFAPAKRLGDIINDCNIHVLLSHSNKKKRLPKVILASNKPLFIIGLENVEQTISPQTFESQPWQWVFDHSKNSIPEVNIIESDLAYIIYTSGTTGNPKGIMHTHHSCLSYVRWAVNEVNVQPNDRLGNHCPLHFDISIFDWFAAAVAGASTIIIPDEYTKLPASYAQLIAQSQMTVLFTVPFALIQLSQYGLLEEQDMSHLRWITFAGEPMPVKHLRTIMHILPKVTFDNMYGPAETNVVTHHKVEHVEQTATAIPIGKMCEFAQGLIVDECGHPVTKGEIGELLVRSPSMMQGYWGRPDLNKTAFYTLTEKTHFDGEFKKTFYRTGDLVKVDNKGIIWFLGRKDRQVKVRGYRVELDEIEAILVSHDNIEEAAVYTVTIADKPVELHATYTVKPEAKVLSSEMSKYLKSRLPSYAVPNYMTNVQAFPRTSSGKIDRKELSKEASYVSNTQ
ncbi:MAG: amino acid adenylation domain-containing protein [Alphaproteobacteria bacterium]|jgi:amino acid adenylation domain-containing protein